MANRDAETVVEGLKETLKTIGKIQNLEDEIEEPTERLLDIIWEKARDYPAPPPGSQYIRTFRLQDSWQKQLILRGGTLGVVSSETPAYNKYVMRRQDQAMIHQNRWQTTEDIAEEVDRMGGDIIDAYVDNEVLNE